MWGPQNLTRVGLQPTSSSSSASKNQSNKGGRPPTWAALCLLEVDEEGVKEERIVEDGKIPVLGSFSCWKTSLGQDRRFNYVGDCRTTSRSFWLRGLDTEPRRHSRPQGCSSSIWCSVGWSWSTSWRSSNRRWWHPGPRSAEPGTLCFDTQHDGSSDTTRTTITSSTNNTSTSTFSITRPTSFITTFATSTKHSATATASHHIQHWQPHKHHNKPVGSAAVSPIWHTAKSNETIQISYPDFSKNRAWQLWTTENFTVWTTDSTTTWTTGAVAAG